jgi:high-affinity Fe2+/Pb2+ permease
MPDDPTPEPQPSQASGSGCGALLGAVLLIGVYRWVTGLLGWTTRTQVLALAGLAAAMLLVAGLVWLERASRPKPPQPAPEEEGDA